MAKVLYGCVLDASGMQVLVDDVFDGTGADAMAGLGLEHQIVTRARPPDLQVAPERIAGLRVVIGTLLTLTME